MTTTTAPALTTNPADLAAALQVVGRVISSRTTLPVLNNVLLEATESGLALTATNLEVGIRKLIQAEIQGPWFATTVPCKLLAEFVGNLPPTEPLKMELIDGRLRLLCGRFDTSIAVIPADEFPPGPLANDCDRLVLSRASFLRAIEQIAMAASTDEARPVLTGALLEITPDLVTLVATDGHRLGEARLFEPEAEAERPDIKIIVPVRALAELGRAFKTEGGIVEADIELLVSPARNQVFFRCGTSEVASRLIDGQYPNYTQVIPTTTPMATVTVATAELAQALKAAAPFAERMSSVRLRAEPFDDGDPNPMSGTLTVSSQAAEVGDCRIDLDVGMTGAEVTLLLNGRYLLDALSAFDGEVEVRIGGALSPVLLVQPAALSNLRYRHVVMPVREGAR